MTWGQGLMLNFAKVGTLRAARGRVLIGLVLPMLSWAHRQFVTAGISRQGRSQGGGQDTFPKPKLGLLTRFGPLIAEVDFLSGFRARGTDQGPAESIGAPQDEPGPRGMDQGPQDESGPCKTDQGPRNGSGPRMSNQGPKNSAGSRWRNQGPVRRIRAPQDESESRRTNQSPA